MAAMPSVARRRVHRRSAEMQRVLKAHEALVAPGARCVPRRPFELVVADVIGDLRRALPRMVDAFYADFSVPGKSSAATLEAVKGLAAYTLNEDAVTDELVRHVEAAHAREPLADSNAFMRCVDAFLRARILDALGGMFSRRNIGAVARPSRQAPR